MYGEEPGPGIYICVCLPYCCLFHLITLPCRGPEPLPSYFCCGISRPVDFHGLTFFVVDGEVQCRINVKHCFTEDAAVLLPDVLDITQVLLRSVKQDIPEDREAGISAHTLYFQYFNFEILYRNEAGQLVRYKTRQLQYTKEGFSRQQHFINVARHFIETNRAQASSLVTFNMLRDEIEAFDVPTEQHPMFKICSRSSYKPPKPQHIMVRASTGCSAVLPVATGYSAAHPVPVATGYSAVQPVATGSSAIPVLYTAVQIAAEPEYDMF